MIFLKYKHLTIIHIFIKILCKISGMCIGLLHYITDSVTYIYVPSRTSHSDYTLITIPPELHDPLPLP